MPKQAVFTMKPEPELRANEFMRRRVEVGRASKRSGQGRSNDEVEAEFAAKRANVANRT